MLIVKHHNVDAAAAQAADDAKALVVAADDDGSGGASHQLRPSNVTRPSRQPGLRPARSIRRARATTQLAGATMR